MKDEPRRHRGFLAVLVATAALTAPWPFAGGSSPWLWGVPAWLLWSAAMTALFAGLTAYGLLRFWKDADG